MDLHDLLDNLLNLDPVRRGDGSPALRENPGTRTTTTTGNRGSSITPTTYRGEPVAPPEEEPRINDIDIAAILREADASGRTPMFRLGANDRAVSSRGVSSGAIRNDQGESRDMEDALYAINKQKLSSNVKEWADVLAAQAKGSDNSLTTALMNNVTKAYTSMMDPEDKMRLLATLNTFSGGRMGEGIDPAILEMEALKKKKKKEESGGWGWTVPGTLAGAGLGFKYGSILGIPGSLVGGALGAGAGMAADSYFADEEDPRK